MKNLILLFTLSSMSLVSANSRWSAAHAHFGGKGWSLGMILGVGSIVLIAGGFIVYWALKGKKNAEKTK